MAKLGPAGPETRLFKTLNDMRSVKGLLRKSQNGCYDRVSLPIASYTLVPLSTRNLRPSSPPGCCTPDYDTPESQVGEVACTIYPVAIPQSVYFWLQSQLKCFVRTHLCVTDTLRGSISIIMINISFSHVPLMHITK